MAETRTTALLPSLAEDEGDSTSESTALQPHSQTSGARRPYLVPLVGGTVGQAFPVGSDVMTIGRGTGCTIRVEGVGISRQHARVRSVDGAVVIEDHGSSNGTFINGRRIVAPTVLCEGDKIQIGAGTVLRFALYDEYDERYHAQLQSAMVSHFPSSEIPTSTTMTAWSPETWQKKPVAQAVAYDDESALETFVTKLRSLPPLVTSWEIEDLKRLIADAQEGRRFLLQGGDCAETLAGCQPSVITNKLKILIQMSLVLIRGARRPVIRVGRFAGQYAKPRSRPTEVRGGVELPSYFGDLINRPEFTPDARRADPSLLLQGYLHAAVTLNFIRALSAGGFADLRRPEYFDLSFFERAELPTRLRQDYAKMCREITDGLHMMRAFGDRSADELMKVTFYTSHEGLNLIYEAAQTRRVPRRAGFYDLTTHMPWIGDRTRALDGAHVEFFRGVNNPVAVKVGPKMPADELVALCRVLNPDNDPGKLVLVTRLGAKDVSAKLPPLVEAVRRASRRVLWVSDPMHGNIMTTSSGIKTRDFESILSELEQSIDVHESMGSYLGGVHFELTGEDVTECIGGGLTEEDLTRNYVTLCDPRLNYRQAIEMAFCLAHRLNETARPDSNFPPAL